MGTEKLKDMREYSISLDYVKPLSVDLLGEVIDLSNNLTIKENKKKKKDIQDVNLDNI
jgi:hypothetical protein